MTQDGDRRLEIQFAESRRHFAHRDLQTVVDRRNLQLPWLSDVQELPKFSRCPSFDEFTRCQVEKRLILHSNNPCLYQMLQIPMRLPERVDLVAKR